MGRNRTPPSSNDQLSKGAWTAMEDQILIDYVKEHGEGKWERVLKHTGESYIDRVCTLVAFLSRSRSIPIRLDEIYSNAGLRRCGKSCRLRWLNYLRPNIKRGNIADDEEDLIIRLHKLLGNR